jgi:hypothetical protein
MMHIQVRDSGSAKLIVDTIPNKFGREMQSR